MSLLKRFNITERVGFVLQGLFQNVFNHPHFRFPNLNISRPAQVAQIARTRSSREKDAKREIFIRARIEF